MKIKEIETIIDNALKEDLPFGDITSENIVSSESRSEAVIIAKEEGVLAGIEVARQVYEKLDPTVSFEIKCEDGQNFLKGDNLAVLKGKSISLLKGERTALNFLQRMSGIATKTRKFVQVIKGTKTKILDTRKTTPGLRVLEKYAVKMGGGDNHRLNLSEMVMIKDNHLRIVGSILKAVDLARGKISEDIKVEVEVNDIEEVREALKSRADIIMLDNMDFKTIKQAVDLGKGKVLLEVSGKVSLNDLKKLASLGVDFISVGSLTHSYKSIDLSMEFRNCFSHEDCVRGGG